MGWRLWMTVREVWADMSDFPDTVG
jgi:hypothetical protein